MTHTPTPWAAFHDHPDPVTAKSLAEIRPITASDHGTSIALVFCCTCPRQQANLAFNVRACNAHGGLVGALKEAQHFLKFTEQSNAPHMDRIQAALLQGGVR